ATDGVRKRFRGRSLAYDVLLLKQPARFGTRWHDAQGSCQVTAEEEHCDGPTGNVDDCLEVVCRLGRGQTLVITSTYARGVGMVRQRLDLVRFLPVTSAGRYPTLPDEVVDVHSVLRLAAYRVVESIGRRRTSHPGTRHRHRPGGDASDRIGEP